MHAERLRRPEEACKPDTRSKFWVVMTANGQRERRLEDQYLAIAPITLHEQVPEDIRIQFETTKNLYLYSWFVYRFYPVAHHHSLTCLELALRSRFEGQLDSTTQQGRRRCRPTLRTWLKYAIDNGYLKNEMFEAWRTATEQRAKERSIMEAISNMEELGIDEIAVDEADVTITDADGDHDYLLRLLEGLPALRNHYAHGSTTLHNQVLGSIRVVAEIINNIFPASLAED